MLKKSLIALSATFMLGLFVATTIPATANSLATATIQDEGDCDKCGKKDCNGSCTAEKKENKKECAKGEGKKECAKGEGQGSCCANAKGKKGKKSGKAAQTTEKASVQEEDNK